MNRWIGYTPDMWATGSEPMTNQQLRYVFVFDRTAGRLIEEKYNKGQNVTKVEASMLLDKYERKEEVTEQYINGLGRAPPAEVPPHPSTWIHCHDDVTEEQKNWIDDLTHRLGIPPAASQKGTLSLKRGQASWLIHILRMDMGKPLTSRHDGEWLDAAVRRSIEEVPFPDRDEIEHSDCKMRTSAGEKGTRDMEELSEKVRASEGEVKIEPS
ncbi:hypothetical protein C8Q74DRAFT_1255289 [Fomes fomentarius]|nr:hypothetical protein C8Q74DRAFT_1255289 [Fomes fomentarius]